MVEGIEYIVQSTYRKLDSYTTGKPQLIPLYALNQDGSVSDKPCIDLDNRVPTIAQSKGQNNVIVRDARTGKLYLQSTEQSRFLKYGCDASAPGDVVVQDHTGAWKAYGDRNALHNGKVSLYSVVHDEQTFAHLSLPRLILLVSIKRAEDVEELIQGTMDKLAESNAQLDGLAQIADLVVKTPEDQLTIDIKTTTINYKNEPVTIYTFLKEIGVNVDKFLTEQKYSTEIQPEHNKLRNTAFWNKLQTLNPRYLPFGEDEQSEFLTNMKNLQHIEDVYHPKLYDWTPLEDAQLDEYIKSYCANGDLLIDTVITVKLKIPLRLCEFPVSDILSYRMGATNYIACATAPSNIDDIVMKDDLLDLVQTQQDDLNNISQETMINLQKLISKRDQAYLLGSVSNKLVLNGNVMIARNL